VPGEKEEKPRRDTVATVEATMAIYLESENIFRVAICQLECHPSFVVGGRDFLEEPFLSDRSDPSLVDLEGHSLDITDLLKECRKTYCTWHAKRLESVLGFLTALDRVPDLVVFPEGAIPIDLLQPLLEFASAHGSAVIAGTHSLSLRSEKYGLYRSLGISDGRLKQIRTEESATRSVLPIFVGHRTHIRLKSVPSIFERDETGGPGGTPPSIRDQIQLQRADRKSLKILPLVCSEALTFTGDIGNSQLVVICAYNQSATPFDPLSKHLAFNRVPVVLCNDGRFGGSGIHVPVERRADSWWWNEAQGRLPCGDGILVMDIDFSRLAPQVGVADPKEGARLVALSSVVANGEAAGGVTRAVNEARQQEDNAVQERLLSSINQDSATPLQKMKIARLRQRASKGNADARAWRVFGPDCEIPGPGLREVEECLASRCKEVVDRLSEEWEGAEDDVKALALLRLKRLFVKRARDPRGQTKPEYMSSPKGDSAIGRDSDAKRIHEFLSNTTESILIVVGLPGIGKSTLIGLAMQQDGRSSVLSFDIGEAATPEFVASSLLAGVGMSSAVVSDPIEAISSEEFSSRLVRGTVVVLQNLQNLLTHGTWRDPRTPEMICTLARLLLRGSGKLVVETTWRIGLEELMPGQIRVHPLRGLDHDSGLILLDQHLRRLGSAPEDHDANDKIRIIQYLDGHPGAIVLAAGYVDKEDARKVADDLGRRGGIHAKIVRRLISDILRQLSASEMDVLGLLGHARAPLSVSVVDEILGPESVRAISELISSSILEKSPIGRVEINSLIRGFTDLPTLTQEVLKKFHESAARFFSSLYGQGETPSELRWGCEAVYHASLCGKPGIIPPKLMHLADGLIGSAQYLIEAGEFDSAKPVIDSLISSYPRAESYQLAAQVYVHLDQCDEAFNLAKEAYARDDGRTWILWEVGRVALKRFRRADIAEGVVSLARSRGRIDSRIADLEGQIHLQNGNEAKAEECFSRAFEMSKSERSGHGWASFFLGRLRIRRGDIEGAITVLSEGEARESGRGSRRRVVTALRTQLGIAYALCGDLEHAKMIFDLIEEEDRMKPEAVMAMIFFRALSGASVEFLPKALDELDPRKAKDRRERCQTHLFRALLLLSCGEKDRASQEFRAAHDADSRDIFVMLKWSETLIEVADEFKVDGEHESAQRSAEDAKNIAEKVLDLDKTNAEARNLLERIADWFNVM
jgi:tetratricopeptide (TPR) repeat protein